MKTHCLTTLLLCGLVPLTTACGPWLPSLLLTEDKQQALHSPKAELITELRRLPALPRLPPGIQPHPFDTEEYRQLRHEGIVINPDPENDLPAALAYYQVPPARREAMVAEYGKVRSVIQQVRSPQLIRPGVEVGVETSFHGLVLPADLPGELAEYLAGAMAFHLGNREKARGNWEKLLSRPPAERRYRSTWAAYMLGRMAAGNADTDETQRAEAIRWLERVRTLVQEGCEDGLNLVGLSYYWEAQIQEGDDHFEKQAQLCGLSLAAGCAWSALYLQGTGEEILGSDDDAVLARAARAPLLRQLVTACALVRYSRLDHGYVNGRDRNAEWLSRWLKAIDTAGVKDAAEADRLAWACYDTGNFTAAAAWLKKAPADAPMALWLRGKLDLRAGHNAEAALRFADAARHIPPPAAAIYPEQNWWWYELETAYPLTQSQQLQADLGITELARARFTPALEALLRTGAWLDAAYVAEQVMTSKELVAYVRQHPGETAKPKPPPGEKEDYPTPAASLRVDVPQALRYLLARRLAREGRLSEARSYMPEPLRARFDEYHADYHRGHDRQLPPEDRAAALWQAARIHRYLGMELFGAETAPDWSFYNGNHEMDDIGGLRAGTRKPEWNAEQFARTPWQPHISPKEIARNLRLRPTPNARFHYRYVAAELAWQAAQLRPPDEETARLLCIAGGWLKNRDPQAADRFYQDLVGRCGQTALGKDGERRRWFPPVEDAPFAYP